MRLVQHRNWICFLVVLLVLYVATVAKVPTKLCRCHDRSETQTNAGECPFKKLRGVSGTFLIAATSVLSPPKLVIIGTFIHRDIPASPVRFASYRSFDAQAPPQSAKI